MEYEQQSNSAGSRPTPAIQSSRNWGHAFGWADYLVLVISLVAILAALYFAFGS